MKSLNKFICYPKITVIFKKAQIEITINNKHQKFNLNCDYLKSSSQQLVFHLVI